MNTFSDERRDESDDLSVMLNDLPRVEPPSTLVGTVMSAIEDSTGTQVTPQSVHFTKRGSVMAKKVLWIVAAAAAVALVVLRMSGYPPIDKGTEATIGAAQRYQAQQISSEDVKTDDAQLQSFLQSDLFRQLAADKAAQQALKNKDFQRAMADASVRAALARPELRYALALAKPEVAIGAQLGAMNLDAAPRAALEAALGASPALAQALAAPGIALAIGNSAPLGAALARPDAARALATDAAINALALAAPGAALDAARNAAPAAAGGAVRNAAPSAAGGVSAD